jgi:putative endonuclease
MRFRARTRRGPFYTYILECTDTSFYTGVTNNIQKRVEQHNTCEDERKYVFDRRPVKLAYVEVTKYVLNAIKREKQIKGWSRAKKIALINGDINALKQLSSCKNPSHYLIYTKKEGPWLAC